MLLRLTTITLPALGFQTRAQLDIDSRGRIETKRFGDFDEIQFIDVEYGAE